MELAYAKIKRIFRLIRNLFPSRVPNGMQEFNDWADSIIQDYNFPDNDSLRFALATMIMHSGPKDAYRAKFGFALMIKASMAKQIAGAVFQDIKIRQAEAEQKRQAEATAAQVVADAEPKA